MNYHQGTTHKRRKKEDRRVERDQLVVPRKKIDEAIGFLKEKAGHDLRVDTGMILGTGFAGLVDRFERTFSVAYEDIPNFPVTTVPGHPGVLFLAKLESKSIAVLQGRTHLYEGLRVEDMLIPIAALSSLGCRKIILTNAAGGLDPTMRPGDLMIISDHINMTGVNPLIGVKDESIGPRFPDAANLYDSDIRKTAKVIAKRKKIPVREGVYLGVTGPSYETPAEVRAFRTLGADAIGMSTVVEALFARYLGMRVFGLSCISNVLLPDKPQSVVHQSVQDTVSEILPKAAEILIDLVGQL